MISVLRDWQSLPFHQLQDALIMFRWFCAFFFFLYVERFCAFEKLFHIFCNQWSSAAALTAQGQVGLGGNWGAVGGSAILSRHHHGEISGQPVVHPALWNPGQAVVVPEHFFISLCVLQSTFVIKLWWGRTGASFKPGSSSSQQWEWMDRKKAWMLNLTFACLNQAGC